MKNLILTIVVSMWSVAGFAQMAPKGPDTFVKQEPVVANPQPAPTPPSADARAGNEGIVPEQSSSALPDTVSSRIAELQNENQQLRALIENQKGLIELYKARLQELESIAPPR